MGFMDKLRSMAAVVTGGGATVQVEAIEPEQDGPFTVNVQAEIADGDVKIENVYLKLMGVETVTLEVEMPVVAEGTAESEAEPEAEPEVEKPTSVMKEISRSEQTYHQEFEVSGEQTLSANQTYTWDVEIQLPDDAKPRYQGVHANHNWKILAGLSAFGNDPDSGWHILEF